MAFLRGNYMEKTAREVLEKSGFKVEENVRSPSGSTIDIVASCGAMHLVIELKRGPVSTLDVSTLNTSIADLRLPEERKVFIFTDSIASGSAASLSEKFKINILKFSPEGLAKTVKQVIEETSGSGEVSCRE
jgi:Holliday junction resolvase